MSFRSAASGFKEWNETNGTNPMWIIYQFAGFYLVSFRLCICGRFLKLLRKGRKCKFWADTPSVYWTLLNFSTCSWSQQQQQQQRSCVSFLRYECCIQAYKENPLLSIITKKSVKQKVAILFSYSTMNQRTTKPTMRPVWSAQTKISRYIHPVRQRFLLISLWISARRL